MTDKKILIVDDEKDTLLVLEKQLSAAGYSVITADNGASCVALAKSQQPDLVILDVQMPDMDGGEVAAILRDEPTTRYIPVIFLTCLISEGESQQQSRKSGGNLMLAKSSDTKELISLIEDILSEKEISVPADERL